MDKPKRLSKADFEARARFRRQLRSFERFGEEQAARHGITLGQYQLLVQIKGMPGRSWALVGELAAALLLKHHTAVELVARCDAAGLVRRERDPDDHRKVRVFLTPVGERKLHAIALRHREELGQLLAHIRQAVGAESGPPPR
ncbi:MarR family winged helix-turn-helix transcriptional regulator [Caenimonas terrae]|uniref:MarR family winged helix-turn-helix transcriptional regulator n=1 Tax=Caenimonas terrae TaxID=696074 RepID=A0ABW0NH15_9BURK